MIRSTTLILATVAGVLFGLAPMADAFCGFYVAKADAQLFNRASQVVLARHDDKTVITMVNDFQGDLSEFAVVIPVPTFLERGQIHVTEKGVIDHLDAFTSPRLVEYYDGDPCRRMLRMHAPYESVAEPSSPSVGRARDEALGVSVEAEYTVGEYDIVILSAEQSDGLSTWLADNGYQTPPGASRVLQSYIRQNVRFFVAKVNLEEQARLGFRTLRPIQVAFESPKFMLPIRLGTVNANGPQDLLVYALTRGGRIETTNYRTTKLPTDLELPLFVKSEFGEVYKAMFARQVEKENMRSVFLEYAWDMAWCDPCAADPLSTSELKELGVFWLDGTGARSGPKAGARDVFVTRLHVRYDGEHFPEDLVFQETPDRSNFQGRYVLRHPFTGKPTCDADHYREELRARRQLQAENLAHITGWDIADIRKKMGLGASGDEPASWWEKLWNRN